jgi:tetratricopeptide (TPR) repeat protein
VLVVSTALVVQRSTLEIRAVKADHTAHALLEQGFAQYQRGDLAAAEATLGPIADHPSALHLMGLVRVRQGRLPEAADLLGQAVAARPQEAQAHFNHGKVLAALGRHYEAYLAFASVIALEPKNSDALFRQGKALQAVGDTAGAVTAFGRCVELDPANIQAALLLGAALVAVGQLAEARTALTRALSQTRDGRSLGDLHESLAAIEHAQGNDPGAVDHLAQALAFDPARIRLELDQGQLLEKLGRYDHAKKAYQRVLDGDPANAVAHRALNDLHYRLGEDAAFLRSYGAAPQTPELALDRAQMLLGAEKLDEAVSAFQGLLAGDDKRALAGLGISLMKLGRLAEAASILEGALQSYPNSADLYCNMSAALARLGDPEKASAMAAKALVLEPDNQLALAMQGTCWRLLGDDRDSLLNGYDTFIQVFDLEAPDGYRDIAAFNADLSRALQELHPATREYLGQSLRGGSQTGNDLFAARHPVIERLRGRIEGAIDQYIAGLSAMPDHPFAARRSRGYGFSGSWSSRLKSGGFHINHLHPGGWISSCYYVDVPAVVGDDRRRQGWIKFGQPSFDVGLEPERAIQPVPGRLVLFPSYMWHGTNPFQDDSVRTTIAFDVAPADHGFD